jgi:hypothetical protein
MPETYYDTDGEIEEVLGDAEPTTKLSDQDMTSEMHSEAAKGLLKKLSRSEYVQSVFTSSCRELSANILKDQAPADTRPLGRYSR